MRRKEPFDIPGITESLAIDVKSGKITLHEAAIELHRAGWTTFVDEERAKRLLRLDHQGQDAAQEGGIGDDVG